MCLLEIIRVGNLCSPLYFLIDVMNKKDILNQFKLKFPDFTITSDSAHYRLAEFNLRSGQLALPYALESFMMDKVKEKIGKFIGDAFVDFLSDDRDCLLFDITRLDQRSLDIIFDAVRSWKQDFDKSLKSDSIIQIVDQVVLIHPDIDDISAPDLLKDCTSIIGKSGSWRIGIISTSTWDFSNQEFTEHIEENSEDCFCIDGVEEDDLDEALGETKLGREYERLVNQRPELAKAKIYITDWD